MRSRRELARSHQWWGHKIPPVLGVTAIAIGRADGSAASLVNLLLLLTSMIGLAAFGHLVNDLSDIEADRRGGKTNLMSELDRGARARLVAGSVAMGLIPWLWLPHRTTAWVALLVEITLLIAYSVPPLRLKARGWLGALADAAYAYAVPFVLTYSLFAPSAHGSASILGPALLAIWGLLVGLRGILWHQIGDHEFDRAAGVETVASRVGRGRTEALVAAIILPAEVATGAALVVLSRVSWLPWLVLGFLVWRCFQVTLLWVPPLGVRNFRARDDRVEMVGFVFVNEFLERWLPVAAFVALTTDSRWWWVALVAYLAVFPSAVRSFVAHDFWLIPDAIQRLALSRGMKAEIRQVAQRRQSRVSEGPTDTDHRTSRFVFVVCGPLPHLLTLRTAIHHLRPVTKCEIWVLTDAERNAQVIDIEGIDHVVNVSTPSDLDDHQASIWLKTSAHRHLPAGEWCYLDSDIIATVPGVEGVFDQRHGPVAFASDVTIRENSVDRFSPWAMNCDCLGYGDEHSCAHLREQLHERFALDVPGDWLHWNGGVFVFGEDSAAFLDLWHERATASFGWPEWKTRDQGALIATVWTFGLQDLPRISPEFNFIADLGNHDLCLDPARGWAHHPEGPWYDPKLLHLYTSPLEDPEWSLGDDVEEVVLRRSRVRVYRWQRAEVAAQLKGRVHSFQQQLTVWRWQLHDARDWVIDKMRRFAHWAKCFFDPRRLAPYRIERGIRTRLGLDVSHLRDPLEKKVQSPQRDAES